jgi:DNA primase
MQESAKYLIHANVTANGVVERSDVVGAIFGQTEGLLGDDLDLRDLQQSSKVGRIDVDIRSENGQSFGVVTIASGLDKVETSILAAALETIERVGPCRANVEIEQIEDVRAAKRREVVERAKDLLGQFEADIMSSQDLVEEVRRAVRVEDITEFEGLPAGPRVADSDAIIVVEGRADVLQLLQFGIKNAIAVEGTNVPDVVARLTQDRTVTAFLDGDRGGDLILKELDQVGSVDYVAFAPESQSVEDLARDEIVSALRNKVPYDVVADASSPHEVAVTDGSARPEPPEAADRSEDESAVADDDSSDQSPPSGGDSDSEGPTQSTTLETDTPEPTADAATSDGAQNTATGDDPSDVATSDGSGDTVAEATTAEPQAESNVETPEPTPEAGPSTATEAAGSDGPPETLAGHVHSTVGNEAGTARLLDDDFGVLETVPADEAFDAIAEAATVPEIVVVDGEVTQRLLDIAAQRGVTQIVGRFEGEFVKQPTSVRIRTAADFETTPEA